MVFQIIEGGAKKERGGDCPGVRIQIGEGIVFHGREVQRRTEEKVRPFCLQDHEGTFGMEIGGKVKLLLEMRKAKGRGLSLYPDKGEERVFSLFIIEKIAPGEVLDEGRKV